MILLLEREAFSKQGVVIKPVTVFLLFVLQTGATFSVPNALDPSSRKVTPVFLTLLSFQNEREKKRRTASVHGSPTLSAKKCIERNI